MAKVKKKTSKAVYWQKLESQKSDSGLTQPGYYHRNKLSVAVFLCTYHSAVAYNHYEVIERNFDGERN